MRRGRQHPAAPGRATKNAFVRKGDKSSFSEEK
jgi:hypothetical protein